MQQVVDLQNSKEFQGLNVELLSISPDSLEAWQEGASEYGIRTPVLSDADNRVASAYGVMQWAMGSEPGHTFILVDRDGRIGWIRDYGVMQWAMGSEPGHTFILVDRDGRIGWIRDYGAPQNGGLMYVPPEDLVPEISNRLAD